MLKQFLVNLTFDGDPKTSDQDIQGAIRDAVQRWIDEGLITLYDEETPLQGFTVCKPAHTATLFAFNNDGGRGDGRQWAMRFVDHVTGKSVAATVCGGESNIYGILRHWNTPGDWDRSIQFVRVSWTPRQWKYNVAGWPHAGSQPEELAEYIRRNLKG